MDPAKRTKIMLEAFRRKVIAHEQASRANESRNQFSLREKMTVTLPLVAIVITLFAGSFSYTGYRSRQLREAKKEAVPPEDGDFGGLKEYLYGEEHGANDSEFLNDANKKW